MYWGISAEWWGLYLLIFLFAFSICIFLGLILMLVSSTCKSTEECAIRSLDIPNIYKLILSNVGSIEASKADRHEISSLVLNYKEDIYKKFNELEKLLSKIVHILETDQVNRDGINKAVSDINSKVHSGIQFKIF
jgi:hypothetical protein